MTKSKGAKAAKPPKPAKSPEPAKPTKAAETKVLPLDVVANLIHNIKIG